MLITMLSGCTGAVGGWARLPSLPDAEGFAGSFAGASDGALLVAGGANFPAARPWDGGTKVWYDTVYVLEKPDGQWKLAGKLPRPLGYGVSVTHKNGLICVGGSDVNRHYADVFRLEWKGGRLITTELAPLPKPIANACGALVGDTLYVAGGLDKPDATETSNAVYRIDLSAPSPSWQEIDPCPGGGRMLSIAAGFDGAFWLIGGVDLGSGAGGKLERRYLKDAFRFDPDNGWQRIADLPHPVVAAPSPAPTDAQGVLVLGGDDGSQIGTPPERHPGFTRTILRYDVRSNNWVKTGEMPAARVTTPCVHWNGSWVIPSGEMRPGVRSPQVWAFTTPTKE